MIALAAETDPFDYLVALVAFFAWVTGFVCMLVVTFQVYGIHYTLRRQEQREIARYKAAESEREREIGRQRQVEFAAAEQGRTVPRG